MLVRILIGVALCSPAASLQVDDSEQATEDAAMLNTIMNSGAFELMKERDGMRKQDPSPSDLAAALSYVDHNGVQCDLCGKPLPERLAPGTEYKEFKTHCGHTQKTVKMALQVPLASYNKITPEGEQTNAFCELNMQKSCVDAVANRDYMYYAKSIVGVELSPARTYDWWYCKQNGWLEKHMVDLAHAGDFDKMQMAAKGLCNTKYNVYNWKKMTLGQFALAYFPGIKYRGKPTGFEARFLGAWNCAMGDAGCDMTYCAYTYCDLGDDVPRLYSECPGWDPIKGNRP